jgi:hypothetical protein
MGAHGGGVTMKQQRNPTDINPYELDYARRHLDYLRRVADPEDQSILYWIMGIVLVIGLVVYVAADQITTGAITLPAGWRPDFVGDFLYNFGIALWTSVLVVFLLEVAVDLQKKANVRYLRKMEQALGVPETATSDESERDSTDALAQQLEAINHTLNDLKAEITAIKSSLVSKPD